MACRCPQLLYPTTAQDPAHNMSGTRLTGRVAAFMQVKQGHLWRTLFKCIPSYMSKYIEVVFHHALIKHANEPVFVKSKQEVS